MMFDLKGAIDLLVKSAALPGRDLQMTGEPQYRPNDLKPYLGYDQRVGWQIIAEWAWLYSLAYHNVFPSSNLELLTPELLETLFSKITTTKVTELERQPEVGHDIIALLMLMREILPKELHPSLHWGLTSYDPISSAYAIAIRETFKRVFYPKCKEIDLLWRQRIALTADILQIGRTHLQHGLPITVGAWLTTLHRRFVNTVRAAHAASKNIPGKFSGAQGNSNALKVMVPDMPLEKFALELLELPEREPTTQIPLPEGTARFYFEIALISTVLAGFGEDVRHLQSSDIGEITSSSSTSSTMSHKESNPVAAENAAGMYVGTRCDFYKVLETMNSDLQRDLRYSNVMRGYAGVMVSAYQELLTTHRVLKSFAVNEKRCQENFWRSGKLVVAELLHLALQKAGYPDAHTLVNKKIVPRARETGCNLEEAMNAYSNSSNDLDLQKIWLAEIPDRVLYFLVHPEEYLGDAVQTARAEVENSL
jgi:adenylosuccinate lyase